MKKKKYLIITVSWALLIAASVYINTPPAVTDIPLKSPFVYFPFEMGEWKGKEVIGPHFFVNSTADDTLTREYENKEGVKVRLYMAYFNDMDSNTRIPSIRAIWWEEGFTVKELGDEKVTGSPDVFLKGMMTSYGDRRYFCLYCYRLGDEYITERSRFKLMTSVNSMLKRSDNALAFEVTAELTTDDPEGAMEAAREFSREVFSLLVSEFLPE